MIPTRRQIIGGLILFALLIVAALFVREQWRQVRSAKTSERVAKGQSAAAIESGADAANTIGNRAAADADADTLTRENTDAIRNADGADAPVAGGVRDAGLASLCRRAAYSRDPRCVQQAPAR
jgi:hypothetical protein